MDLVNRYLDFCLHFGFVCLKVQLYLVLICMCKKTMGKDDIVFVFKKRHAGYLADRMYLWNANDTRKMVRSISMIMNVLSYIQLHLF